MNDFVNNSSNRGFIFRGITERVDNPVGVFIYFLPLKQKSQSIRGQFK